MSAITQFAAPSNDGQMRVLVLLIVLFVLELVAHPTLLLGLQTFKSNLNTNLSKTGA